MIFGITRPATLLSIFGIVIRIKSAEDVHDVYSGSKSPYVGRIGLEANGVRHNKPAFAPRVLGCWLVRLAAVDKADVAGCDTEHEPTAMTYP